MILMMLLCVMFTGVTVQAEPRILKTTYNGYGNVTVRFMSTIYFKNLKVTVKATPGKNNSGKKATVSILSKNKDYVKFKIKNYEEDTTYTYQISGVKTKSDYYYGTVKGKVYIPKSNKIKSVTYNAKAGTMNIKFSDTSEWKNAKVSVLYGGKEYVTGIKCKGKKEITVKLKKLKAGTKYTIKVSGIRKKGETKYTTLKGSFKK